MGKQRNITPRVAQSYDDAFKAFNEVVKQNKGNTGFGSLGSEASSTFRGYNTGIGNSDYDKNLSWNANIDEENVQGSLNEFRANEQSALDHLGIGAVRTVAKAATEVAKLPGVIGGIAMSPFAAENEGFETAFNNQWIQYFDGLDEKVKEALPVYTKEAVKNGDFFDKISSSAFWAEDGADGAGFMLGMLAPGAIFKFAGGAEALFGTSMKVAQLAKYGENAQAASKFLEKAGITIKNIDQYMIPAFNTISEAGSEAKGVSDDMDSRKGEFMTNAINIQGMSPEQAEVAFKEQKALAMQNTFLKNVAVLAVPNYIQAKLLFGKTPSKVLLDKIGGEIEKGGFWQSAKKVGKRIGESFLSEGSEEVAQTAIQHRNTDEGIKGKLGDSRIDDYNPLTFGSDFIKTLGTTEGQISGFLGGMMGAPVEIVTGHFQDIADRKETARLREKINGASTAYSDIRNTDLYEKEQYTNPETGQVDTRDKVVDGNKVLIPEAVVKVKNALDLTENQGKIYDKAIEEGDTETLEYLKGQGEFNLIQNFIGEDEVTLDALHEYLKVAFPTETSKDVSKDQVKINKENTERVDNIMKKAKSLQKDLTSYKDMAASLIRINNPNVTKEHLSDFMNRVANTFLSERAEEFDAKEKLNKLEKQRNDLESNTPITETENPNYIEGKTEDIFKTIKTKTNNPRLDLVNKQIDKVKEQLKSFSEATNSTIWDNKFLNNKINNEVIAKEKLQKAISPEEVAKNNDVINKTKNATTVDEVKEIEKTSPKETIENPAIKEQIDNKKAELKKAKEDEESGIISNAKEDDEAFNGTSKTQTYSTEGSDISNELTPKTSENTTKEEDDEGNKPDATNGWGTKLISYDRNTGEAIWFVDKFFSKGLEFERNPVNKIGNPVGFEINENPGTSNGNVTEALKQFKEGNFQNIQLLIDYLPINIKLAEGTYLPIETRRLLYEKYVPGKPLKLVYDKDGNTVPGKMNLETGMLRKSLITSLINGVPIENINSNITGQYKGVLQVESPTAENNLLDLSGVDGLKYIKENTYFVNIHGQLENVLTGQTRLFQAKFTKNLNRTKDYATGEIYLIVPQADGVSQFPLKLNISKLTIEESEGLFEIYKEILTQDKGSNTTLSEVSPELLSVIKNIFDEQLKIIAPESKFKDIKLGEIIDLLVHESDKPKSRINITDGVLYFGENGTANSGNIDELKEEIMYFLHTQKRHQIKIRPKTAEDNQRTNLSSNSANYIKYLVEGKILSTNAVVNEPLFQGYTNLFISPTVTIKGSETKKSTTKVKEYTETEIEDRLKGVRTIKELAEGFKTLSEEQQDLYKPLFTEKRIQIEDKGKVKVSDAGAETDSKNWEGLDFGDKKVTTQPITGLSITYTPTGKKTQTYTINKNKIINSKGEEVFKEDSADRRKIFANVAIKEGRAKVIEDNNGVKYVVNNRQQIMSTATGKIMEWAENHATRKLLLDKYNKSVQFEISDSGVKVNADNTGFNEMFENKSQNTRNVENNSVSLPESTTVIEDLSDSNKFVSSSDIPNTVENKQQMEKQNEVFKEPKGLEGQKDTKTITLLKDKVEKGTATEANLKQLENLKNKYGEEYVKKCK